MLGAVDWTNVLVALIAGLPAIIAALFAGLVHRQVRTPSGPSIGKQVEAGHLTAIANNMQLTRLNKGNGPTKPLPAEAVTEEHPPQVAVEDAG